MSHYNPIQSKQEFNSVCKQHLDPITRVIEYVIDDLDTGWRNLSRRESDIRKHQLKFLEDLLQEIENAAVGTLSTGVRS